MGRYSTGRLFYIERSDPIWNRMNIDCSGIKIATVAKQSLKGPIQGFYSVT